MYISKKDYDKLNARTVELARKLKEKEDVIKDYQEENDTLKKEKEVQHSALREVIKLTTINRYNNAGVIIRKIKESAETAINS